MLVTLRLALLFLVAAHVAGVAQDASVTVRGRVIAADNSAALPRARVTIVVDGEPGAPVYTDEQGRFNVAAPSAASFALSVIKAGYAAMQMPLQREALATAPAREVAIALTRSAAVSGRIVDTTGETVIGLRVYADRLDPDATTATHLVKFSTTTDDRGEYRLGGLPPGRYSVTATGAQDPGAVVRLDLRPGDDVADIGFTAQPPQATAMVSSPQPPETPERATIRGRVLTTTGRPIAQAGVNITGPMPPRFFLTDAQGRFAFTGLVPGDYEVQASKGDFLPAPVGQATALQSSSRIALTTGARVNDVTLVLSRGLAVTGTIVDRAGEPLQGVSVQALQVSTSGDRQRAVLAGAQIGGGRQTDDRGRYRVLGLQPGTYVIAALADAASLRDAPSLGEAPSLRDAQTVPFYFPGSASIADAVTVTATTAEVDGIDFAVGDVPTARVTGKALDSNGAPLAGRVTLGVSHRSGSIVPDPPRGTRIEPDGTFTFFNVGPGDYVVQAVRFPTPPNLQLDRPVLADFRDSVEFAAEYVAVGTQDAEPVTLRTARGSVLEATINVDSASSSQSPDRMQIDAHPIEGDLTYGSFSLRASGVPVTGGNRSVRLTLIGPWRFVVSGMPDGWYLKSLTINGSEMTDQVIDLGVGGGILSGEVVVSPKGGTIAGRITTERRAARDGAAIVVFPQDREKWFERSRFIKVVRASQDGSFRVSSLPPGEYHVAVTTTADQAETARPEVFERLMPRAARVMLDEGDERRVELPLQ
jgi:protocatechuate 3,4-dioxygenase beta subunit